MPRQINSFFLVLKDEDHGLFTVVGPMTDDTQWNNRVCQAQNNGRLVRCFSAEASHTKDQVITNVRQELKLKYTDEIFL